MIMSTEQRGISITLPALNEAENIESLAEEIIDYFVGTNLPYEIIIVNDGSSDKTGAIADALASRHETVSVLHHAQNQGYGKSLRDGFHASRYEYVFFTDADRQFRIRSLDNFLPCIRDGRADMVIGYRIHRQDARLRKVLSWIFNKIMQLLFAVPYKDIDCAFKLIKRELVERLEMQSDDFLFNAELLAKAQSQKSTVVQIGVEHYPRSKGESTVSFKHIPLTLRKLLYLYRVIKDFKKRNTVVRNQA
jgi:glycosyltransferase involved in cell wall biosynthesis